MAGRCFPSRRRRLPSPSIEYYVNLWQKLDATAGIEQKNAEIIAAVRGAIAAPGAVARPKPGARKGAARLFRGGRRKWWVALASVLVVVAVGLGLGFGLAGHDADSSSSVTGSHNTWAELSPSGPLPRARYGHDMELDSSSGLLVMFGGLADASAAYLNDTWAYDPAANTWTDLKPSGALPSARFVPAMAYDPKTDRVIMFGGRSADVRLNDTWAYDSTANAWSEMKPAGPLPAERGGHEMVYDPPSGRIIMFGGRTGSVGEDASAVYLNDTWAYDPAANAWTDVNPSGPLPYARIFPRMAYDPSSHRVIMFGGSEYFGNSTAPTQFNDTWAYDPVANTWTELSPSGTPPPPDSEGLVYDPSTGLMITLGGQTNDSTWGYDPRANAWADLSPDAPVPSLRSLTPMAYDPANGRLIMFGGWSSESLGSCLSDTWGYTP